MELYYFSAFTKKVSRIGRNLIGAGFGAPDLRFAPPKPDGLGPTGRDCRWRGRGDEWHKRDSWVSRSLEGFSP